MITLDQLIEENEKLISQFPDDIALKIGLRDLLYQKQRCLEKHGDPTK